MCIYIVLEIEIDLLLIYRYIKYFLNIFYDSKIENLIELRSSIAVLVCEKTHILKFLLMR